MFVPSTKAILPPQPRRRQPWIVVHLLFVFSFLASLRHLAVGIIWVMVSTHGSGVPPAMFVLQYFLKSGLYGNVYFYIHIIIFITILDHFCHTHIPWHFSFLKFDRNKIWSFLCFVENSFTSPRCWCAFGRFGSHVISSPVGDFSSSHAPVVGGEHADRVLVTHRVAGGAGAEEGLVVVARQPATRHQSGWHLAVFVKYFTQDCNSLKNIPNIRKIFQNILYHLASC